MILLLVVAIVLIWCEVLWDSYHEVKLNQSPDYEASNRIRILIGTTYWALSSPMYPGMNMYQFLMIPVILIPLFSFVFDWGLNVMRNYWGVPREYYYLGDNSKTDVWQKNHGGAKLWFYLKLTGIIILMAIFVLIKT